MKKNHNYIVIMAGGTGTRLWPLSRKNLPKQMQKLINDRTLIDETIQRFEGVVPAENVFVSVTKEHADKIRITLPNVKEDNIIIEPLSRGRMIAYTYVTKVIYDLDPEAIIFSLPSDHAVDDVNAFKEAVTRTFTYIEDNSKEIVLIGTVPTRPDTGMGYIKVDKQISTDPVLYTIEKFVEKPVYQVANSYVNSGEYYWNAAYYGYKASTLLEAYKEADPMIIEALDTFMESQTEDDFMKIPQKEHEIETINATKYPLILVPADFTWTDIGNWQTLHELLSSTEGSDTGLHIQQANEYVDTGSSDCLVVSTDHKLVATVGLKDVVIVSTSDVLLVMNRNKPQEIKQIIDTIEKKGLESYL